MNALFAGVRDDLARRGVDTPTPAEIAVSVQRVQHGDTDLRIVDDVRSLAREFSGLGELAVPLADPEVTDVLLNGPGPVWVDRGSGMEPTDLVIGDTARCREIAVRLATACGVRLDDVRPFADGVLTGRQEHHRGGRRDLTVLIHGRIDEALLGVAAGGQALYVGQRDLLQGDAVPGR